ncbi:MAG: PD-(D/E)XK nuclease family protein [Burkholderiaceae bacterium]|jgi:ATP-dependent helicase/nuclease subunit B|nr:PD-(D/E)XK nuclease family protein [Burkholderiaceae bacterium]
MATAWSLWQDPQTGLVTRIAREMAMRGLHPARTVVLVPYAQLIAVARQMWVMRGAAGANPANQADRADKADGFMPRFETTHSWARNAGAFVPGEDDIAFDMGNDLLTAQSLLKRAGLAHARAVLAPRLVQLAHQLAALAAAQMPHERPAWSARLRPLLGDGEGSEWFGVEAALHAIALAWATASGYATDVLLQGQGTQGAACRQADALIVLEGLQTDPLTETLARLFGAPLRLPLHVPGEPSLNLPLDGPAVMPVRAGLHMALDPEDEAERAAACVLARVAEGATPVALVATDRVLTRRISALLDGRGVPIRDETGWKLSTTRAAAHVMGALRAAQRDASSDAVLDWLKCAPAFDETLVCALEERLRAGGLRDWADGCKRVAARATAGVTAGPCATANGTRLGAFIDAVETQRAALARARGLEGWRAAMRSLLQAGGQWQGLERDAAGARLIVALELNAPPSQLEPSSESDPGWSLNEFIGWVSAVLESDRVVLTGAQADVPVVVLPLHQLLARPFSAVVLPGCDELHLPVLHELPGDWTRAQREALGLPSRAQAEAAQRAAWHGALRAPRVDLLCHAFDSHGESVRPSALLQALRFDGGVQMAPDPRALRTVPAAPCPPPLPRGDALPVMKLSASAYADLRHCPYRFFALRQLGLRDAQEIDTELGKRDWGTWLHLALSLFHRALQAAPEQDRVQRLALIEAAQERAMRVLGFSNAEFLPFAAAWPAARDGYLDWLADHETHQNLRFAQSEVSRQQALGDVTLVGQLDRIDQGPAGAFVIDYKTEPLETTRKRVKDPFEDVQLTFYAALLEDDTLRAAYVNVGESGLTRTVELHDVVSARDALVTGITRDLQRIAQGTPLPALGDGAVCAYCAARGLCRKDWWTAAPRERGQDSEERVGERVEERIEERGAHQKDAP